MGLPRFFAPLASESGATIELPDDERAHLTRVLRLNAGAQVRVFDGHGREWEATVALVSKQSVTVTLGSPVVPSAEPRIALTLAIAVLKGDKTDDIVRDAVMMGVVTIQPIVTTRAETSAASVHKGGRVSRWQRIAVSSAKQCGRAVVPAIRDVTDLSSALSDSALKLMLVEPGAGLPSRGLREVPPGAAATLFVGPEGGWTTDEVRRAQSSGAILVTLGNTTLRADAVPLVALTALRVHWNDFDGGRGGS